MLTDIQQYLSKKFGTPIDKNMVYRNMQNLGKVKLTAAMKQRLRENPAIAKEFSVFLKGLDEQYRSMQSPSS